MTTVAWDGKRLACDRLGLSNGVRRNVTKIRVCGMYVYAGCGNLDEVMRIGRWLENGASPDTAPTLEEGGSNGLAVWAGNAFVVEGKVPALTPILEKFYATGSGRDFALSAMAFGKNAVDAVTFASEWDAYSGNGVDVYDVESDSIEYANK